MLHELLALRAILFKNGKEIDPYTVYDRKLEIIERNLYGVDIDPRAVRTARLRLWLSLIVDFQERHPPQLPFLDYKIMVGDSLLEAVNGQSVISGRGTEDAFQFGLVSGRRGEYQAEFVELRDRWIALTNSLTSDEARREPHGKSRLEERRALKERLLEVERELMLEVLAEQKQDLGDRRQELLRRPHTKNKWGVVPEEHEIARIQAQLDVIIDMEQQIRQEGKRPVFPFHLYFAEVFASSRGKGGFDIILANPPYVRADAQYNHLRGDEEKRQKAITNWKNYRTMIAESQAYQTLYEKWDLYMPFLERAWQLLRPNGHMVFIIADSYNTAKYAARSHAFFLANTRVERVDFCSDIPLFKAEVRNTILHFSKKNPSADHKPVRVRHWGRKSDDFEANAAQLDEATQDELGEALFWRQEKVDGVEVTSGVPLGNICYVSVGMVVHADEKRAQGLFKAEDLVSDTPDADHPKPYVEGKDIGRWDVRRIHFLEYGTPRSPELLRRPTFPQLHGVSQRLLSFRMCGGTPTVAFDDRQLYSNHTVIIFVPWHLLKGVRNKSIKKTAKYHDEAKTGPVPAAFREDLEHLSQKFDLKYLLAVMNSSFTARWLAKRPKGKLDVYPNIWKQLPVPIISAEKQAEFASLVDGILAEFQRHSWPLPLDAAERVARAEEEINRRVFALYSQKPEEMALLEQEPDGEKIDAEV